MCEQNGVKPSSFAESMPQLGSVGQPGTKPLNGTPGADAIIRRKVRIEAMLAQLGPEVKRYMNDWDSVLARRRAMTSPGPGSTPALPMGTAEVRALLSDLSLLEGELASRLRFVQNALESSPARDAEFHAEAATRASSAESPARSRLKPVVSPATEPRAQRLGMLCSHRGADEEDEGTNPHTSLAQSTQPRSARAPEAAGTPGGSESGSSNGDPKGEYDEQGDVQGGADDAGTDALPAARHGRRRAAPRHRDAPPPQARRRQDWPDARIGENGFGRRALRVPLPPPELVTASAHDGSAFGGPLLRPRYYFKLVAALPRRSPHGRMVSHYVNISDGTTAYRVGQTLNMSVHQKKRSVTGRVAGFVVYDSVDAALKCRLGARSKWFHAPPAMLRLTVGGVGQRLGDPASERWMFSQIRPVEVVAEGPDMHLLL
jgi:hypothetical protein